MNDFFSTIVLGITQGISEFLPISSSGHLRILHDLITLTEKERVAFDVMLHFATLLAVMLVYRHKYIELIKGCFATVKEHGLDLKSSYKNSDAYRTAVFVVLTSIPTAIIGLLFKGYFEDASLTAVGISLLITGVILLIPKFVKREGKEVAELTWKFAVILGLAQACAIMPGISRSGTTISIALLLGSSRSFSGYYSFLIMIPAVAGATLLKLPEIMGMDLGMLTVGFFSALLSGYIALKVLLKLLDKGKFYFFSPYCILVGAIVLIFLA